MKAMIFAAGLGTRLRPLTHHRPKALVEVGGKCLLEIVIRRLLAHGFEEIVVNVHHFAGQVEAFLAQHAGFGARIAISDERSLLLDTGGGLRQAAWFFDEQPFLVHNVDVLSDIDLTAMYQAHLQSGALATLACRRRQSSRYLLFDEQNHLCGWKNVKSGEVRMSRQVKSCHPLAFSGIHVIDPNIFAHLSAK
ncbi:MAG: nucleotidyltransferase family protein, partial [Bacteroidetes bacterium]